MNRNSIPTPLIVGFLTAESIIYIAFLALDLLGRGSETYGLKYGGILLCLAFALTCALRGGDRLVAPALAFTACADWFLLIRNDHLPLGVALFLCVQALYLLRLRLAGGPLALWLRISLALTLFLALYWLNLATPLNLLAVLYFSQLLSNCILAWKLPSMRRFALGLSLFVGCDVCVGLFNSSLLAPAALSPVSIGMWFFYLPSQVLIALSAPPPKEVPREKK